MTDPRRPRIDDLIRTDACRHEGPHPASLRTPIDTAEEDGIIGWCVAADQCHEIRPALARRIGLHEVPILAGVAAFSEGLIGLADLREILRSGDRGADPRTAVLCCPNHGTFSGLCWCGYLTEARGSHERAGQELAEHLAESHSLRLAAEPA